MPKLRKRDVTYRDQLTDTVPAPTAYSSTSVHPIDPADEFAERRVGIGIGAAGDGDHARKFGVAHTREGAAQSGNHKADDNSGTGVVGRGNPCQGKQARADDSADAEPDEAPGDRACVSARVCRLLSKAPRSPSGRTWSPPRSLPALLSRLATRASPLRAIHLVASFNKFRPPKAGHSLRLKSKRVQCC